MSAGPDPGSEQARADVGGDSGGDSGRDSGGDSGRDSERGKAVLRLWLRMLDSTTLIEQHLKGRLREQFEVTLAQFDLMAEIARDDTPKTMTEISQMLMVSNGNVTGVVDRLSRDGLVKRTPSPTDRRAYLLSLTPDGKALFATMAQAHERWLEGLFGDLDRHAVDALSTRLKELRDSLKSRREVEA